MKTAIFAALALLASSTILVAPTVTATTCGNDPIDIIICAVDVPACDNPSGVPETALCLGVNTATGTATHANDLRHEYTDPYVNETAEQATWVSHMVTWARACVDGSGPCNNPPSNLTK